MRKADMAKERRRLEAQLYEIHKTISRYDRGGKVSLTGKWHRTGYALNELLDLARKMKRHGIDGYANSIYMLVEVIKYEITKYTSRMAQLTYRAHGAEAEAAKLGHSVRVGQEHYYKAGDRRVTI